MTPLVWDFISVSIFMDSRTTRVSPELTESPTLTFMEKIEPGSGEVTTSFAGPLVGGAAAGLGGAGAGADVATAGAGEAGSAEPASPTAT